MPITLRGREYRMLVDTGSTHAALLPSIIEELRLPRLSAPLTQYTLGENQGVEVPVFRLSALGIGSHWAVELDAIPLIQPSFLGVDGILGMDRSSGFPRVCLDFASPALELHLDE